MILVDTSVWVDHLNTSNKILVKLLDSEQVLTHPFVIGELALGHLPQRYAILNAMRLVPQTLVASHDEVLEFINKHKLFGLGIGYVDVHLLAAARLGAGTTVWTRDRRLHDAAQRLSLAANLPGS